ncbi:MAG TPA: hypothetical protein VIE42_12600 [Steroidobacteraceae bacterium]|jgi:hypothetical protein
MNTKDASLKTYRPETWLIDMAPGFNLRRLGEIELGRLVLLGNSRDGRTAAGLGIRADALSRAGDLTEGIVRLGPAGVRFERHELDQNVMAVSVDFVLEPDLASAAVRRIEAGDLIISPANGAVGVLVTGPWQGLGLLDIGSAVTRPFADSSARSPPLSLAWQLVHREERRRILFTHSPDERPGEYRGAAPPRYTGEQADEDD